MNRKIKSVLIILVICLITLVGFSKAGILFAVDKGDIIKVTTTKKAFKPSKYLATVNSVYIENESAKKDVVNNINNSVNNTTTINTTRITTKKEIMFDGLTVKQVGEKLNKKFKGSLTGKGETFAKLAMEKGMDPFLLAAITVHETAFGQSKAAINKFNYGGIMCSGKLCTYDSVEHGIYSYINMVYKNYFSKGLTTAEQMHSRYAASPTWASKVDAHYKDLRN